MTANSTFSFRFGWMGWLSLYLTTLAIVVYQVPAAWSPYVFNCDSRQHIAWMYSWADPELFPNDYLKKYYFDTFATIGYKTLFQVTADWIDPQTMAEGFGIILTYLAAGLAFGIGKRLAPNNPYAGLCGLAVFLVSGLLGFEVNFIRWSQGGLQRAALMPALLLAVLGILSARPSMMACAVLGAAVFYPPAAIMIAAIWGCELALSLMASRRLNIMWGWYVVIVGSTGLYLWIMRPAGWTNFTYNEAVRMIAFFDPLVAIDSRLHEHGWSYLRAMIPFQGHQLVALFICLGWIVRRRLNYPWRLAGAIVIGSWTMYGLAYLVFNRLYEPGRYVYPLTLLWLLAGTVVSTDILDTILQRIPWAPARSKAAITIGVLVATALAIGLCRQRIQTHQGGVTRALPIPVYHFLGALPKDTLIAGHPSDICDVPLLSRRRALLLPEAIYPAHKEFFREIDERLRATIRALYAPDLQPVRYLRDHYGVDYLIVSDRRWNQDPYRQSPVFAAEYERAAQELVGRSPAIQNLPPDASAFTDGQVRVIDLKKLQ